MHKGTQTLAQPMRSVTQIVTKLRRQHPNAFTELVFRNAYELTVAVILSAQSTDQRVNQVTPALFGQYPTALTLSKAKPVNLEAQIRPTGLFRSKTRSLIGMARRVVSDYAGEIPSQLDDLVALPGVGRKTANAILGHAFNVPSLSVDRHILRVSNRLGIARGRNPVDVERQLAQTLPVQHWTLVSDTLILHGRRICKPRPLCVQCAVKSYCCFYARMESSSPSARHLGRVSSTR